MKSLLILLLVSILLGCAPAPETENVHVKTEKKEKRKVERGREEYLDTAIREWIATHGATHQSMKRTDGIFTWYQKYWATDDNTHLPHGPIVFDDYGARSITGLAATATDPLSKRRFFLFIKPKKDSDTRWVVTAKAAWRNERDDEAMIVMKQEYSD